MMVLQLPKFHPKILLEETRLTNLQDSLRSFAFIESRRMERELFGDQHVCEFVTLLSIPVIESTPLVIPNSTTDYSCMPARFAERALDVKPQIDTLAQLPAWYSTPAGQIFEPDQEVLEIKNRLKRMAQNLSQPHQSLPISNSPTDGPKLKPVPEDTVVWYDCLSYSCGHSQDSSVSMPLHIRLVHTTALETIREPEVKHEVPTVELILDWDLLASAIAGKQRPPPMFAVKQIRRPRQWEQNIASNELHSMLKWSAAATLCYFDLENVDYSDIASKNLVGTHIVQLSTVLQHLVIDFSFQNHFMEQFMKMAKAHTSIGEPSDTEQEKGQHTDGLIHVDSFDCGRNLGGHHPGIEGFSSLMKAILCLVPCGRPPSNVEETKAASEGVLSTAQSDNESIFSAPFEALSVGSSDYSFDYENECQYTLENGQFLGGNATLLENVLSTLPINQPTNFGERHGNLDPGDLPQGYIYLVRPYCNERLLSGVYSGKGAKGAVIFADSQIPGHNEFVKDPVHGYWTWSSEEGNWWHQDEGTNAVVWAPLDFD